MGDRARKGALAALQMSVDQLKTAQAVYDSNILKCSEVGVPNTQIARVLGVSEVAVRGWLKRRGVEGKRSRG